MSRSLVFGRAWVGFGWVDWVAGFWVLGAGLCLLCQCERDVSGGRGQNLGKANT